MDIHIEFGPFKTRYHMGLVGARFRASVERFISDVLVAQTDEGCSAAQGKVVAEVNEDRFCGPRSLVRDNFDFDLTLSFASGPATFKSRLRYRDGGLTAVRGFSTYLWTQDRVAERERQTAAIEAICDEVLDGGKPKPCPICQAPLEVVNVPAMFNVQCSKECFVYNFHRDPESGDCLHGHFFMNDP